MTYPLQTHLITLCVQTVSAISTFLLAMVIHPEVYQKIQEEIDRVVGHDRFPSFADRHSLPYLDCVLKETYRWAECST
jgi:cytochrome P450